MARLFTVPFFYKEQTFTAVVSVTQCNGKQTVSIHVPDESLHPILQTDLVSFDAAKGLPLDSPTLTPAQEVLVCILIAIDQYDQQLKLTASKKQSL